ncbi:MAG: ABC transporter substrate-binding protein [Deltaproteobacteria bacterium]|nr:ABC transporter substrate-binding protein [Deltaproteobacteria bacterium]
MSRRRVAMLLALLVVFGTYLPARGADRLTIGYTAISGVFAGLWVADHAGIFEKYGIRSGLAYIPAASKMVQTMLGGDILFAGAGGIAAVEANLAGGDFLMVGAVANVPAFYILALPEIKSVADLRGKTVGVTRLATATDFTMRYLLRKHGLEPGRDVHILQTGDLFAAAAALRIRSIVAAPFSSPADLQARKAGARELVNMAKAGIYFPHDAWMARRGFIAANEDLVRRFLKGYSEGVHRLHADREVSRRAIARIVRSTDPEVLDAVYKYAVDYIDKVPYVVQEGIQEVLTQVAVKNPKARTAKPEEFYDNRYVKELETAGFYKQLWGK